MKKDSANEVLIQDADRDLAQSSESRNRDTKSFAHQLRALGQALEKFSFSAFELELCSGGYLVTGKLNPVENVKFSFSRFARELLRGFSGRPALTTDMVPPCPIKYTLPSAATGEAKYLSIAPFSRPCLITLPVLGSNEIRIPLSLTR